MDWYVIQAYSGYEQKVKAALLERITLNNLSKKFGEIFWIIIYDGAHWSMSRFSWFLANFRERYTVLWWPRTLPDCHKNSFLRTSDRMYVSQKIRWKNVFLFSKILFKHFRKILNFLKIWNFQTALTRRPINEFCWFYM